jgi:hypothetical protein
MNVEPPETFVIIESIVYKSNGFAIDARLEVKTAPPCQAGFNSRNANEPTS